MEKKGIFIEPKAQKRWYFAMQRGETTTEHIAKYLGSHEPREHWRGVFKSYFVFLKHMREHFGDGYATNSDYRTCHDVVAKMFMKDVRSNYTDATVEIISRYITFFDREEIA